MRILIIGASSYLGARFYVDLKKYFDVVGTYSSNRFFPDLLHLDITSKKQVETLVSQIKPDLIIHCANLPKNAPMKENPDLAKKVNLDGTGYLVEAANKIGAKFIFISTIASKLNNDYYTSYKFESEKIVKTTNSGWLILQPAYILGYSPNTVNDRPFNRLYKNIVKKTPAVYDTSWRTQSSYIGQIVEIILTCIKKNIWNESIPISVSEVKSRYEIARDILKHFDMQVASVDKKDTTDTIEDDQSTLKRLGLPVYSYDEIIGKIVDETKRHLQSGL